MESMSSERAQSLGYRRLYSSEHLQATLKIIEQWEPERDVFSLKYGFNLGVGLSFLTPLPLFRALTKYHNIRMLKIGMGYSFRVVPMILPAFATWNMGQVNRNNILMESPACSVCHEIRGLSTQLSVGYALPIFLALVSKGYFLFINRIHIPSPLTMEYFQWVKNVSQHCRGSLSVMLLAQIVVSSLVVNDQLSSWAYVKEELRRRISEDSKD